MDLMSTIKKPIEQEIADFNGYFNSLLKSDVMLMNDALSFIGESTGKMMRPLLLLLIAKSIGNINDKSYSAAAAVEMLHTASLLHDDVIDESDKRRGRPSLNTRFNNNVAVLTGEITQTVQCEQTETTDITESQIGTTEPETTETKEPKTTTPEPTQIPEPTQTPGTTTPVVEESTITEDSIFEVHFIDVGQADSALVLCDGQSMLIDGGNTEDSSLIYSYLKNKNVSHINYIIATHAHEDHVGGLAGALNYATVDTVYCPVKTYDSGAFKDFVKYVEKRNAEIKIPEVDTSFHLGSAKIEILACNSTSDTNNSSIVLKITYGDTSFLFTADAEREAEQVILNAGYDLNATVLKVGHHGSENSTTYPFLREIMPEYAVISVGNDNSYGHPTDDALSRLRDAGVKVYRTDLQGHVICTSDGKTVSFTVEKNPNADTLKLQEPEEVGTTTPVTPPTPAPKAEQIEQNEPVGTDYIGNQNSKIFHYDWCGSVKKMKESNKYYYTGTREEIISKGYRPCQNCNP